MRIGILGGTFDPIHLGHTQPAEEVKQSLNLDEIWLMPNHIPPHKLGTQVTTSQRIAMTELACRNHSNFKVCDIEAQRSTPSYTSETLAQLKRAHPKDEFYFLMGMDSFASLTQWHNWQQIFDYAHIVVCQRPGTSLPPTNLRAQLFEQSKLITESSPTAIHGRIHLVDTAPIEYSSTEIRDQLTSGLIPEGLEDEVRQFIVQNNLYSPS